MSIADDPQGTRTGICDDSAGGYQALDELYAGLAESRERRKQAAVDRYYLRGHEAAVNSQGSAADDGADAAQESCWQQVLRYTCFALAAASVLLFVRAGWRTIAASKNRTPVAAERPVSASRGRPRITKIENILVGDRVAGSNPIHAQAEISEPDQATWRHISLKMRKENGLSLWIELLRPQTWIEAKGSRKGETIFLALPEMGALGDAIVEGISPCPLIKDGTGAVVTGTFRHECDGSNVVHLYLEGQSEPIGVTTNHLFWSEDRQQFIDVGHLRDREMVNGLNGPHRIAAIKPLNYDGMLYNLETTEHVFRVGSLGTLVHNSCLNRGGAFSQLDAMKESGEVAHHMPQIAAGATTRGRGPALGMTIEDHSLTRTFRWRGAVTNMAESELSPMERLDLDVADVRRLFGDKYDKGIAEMLEYVRSLAEFQ